MAMLSASASVTDWSISTMSPHWPNGLLSGLPLFNPFQKGYPSLSPKTMWLGSDAFLGACESPLLRICPITPLLISSIPALVWFLTLKWQHTPGIEYYTSSCQGGTGLPDTGRDKLMLSSFSWPGGLILTLAHSPDIPVASCLGCDTQEFLMGNTKDIHLHLRVGCPIHEDLERASQRPSFQHKAQQTAHPQSCPDD